MYECHSPATASFKTQVAATFEYCEDIRTKAKAIGAPEGDQCAARALCLQTDPPLSCTARSRMRYRSHGWTSHWVVVTREYMRIKRYA